MTIAQDQAAYFAGLDAKLAAGATAQTALTAVQADATSAHTALTAALASDATDKAAATDALAKLATATATLTKAQSDLTAMTAKDANDQTQIATLTAQMAAAKAAQSTSTASAPVVPATPSMQMLKPFVSSVVNGNQQAAGARVAKHCAYPDTPVPAGPTVFSGTSNGLKNMLFQVISDGFKGYGVTPAADGTWSVTVDTSNLQSGPQKFQICGWDSVGGQPSTVTLNGIHTVLLSNPAKPVPALKTPAQVTPAMKLVLNEDFTKGLDEVKSTFQLGKRLSSDGKGDQWGSASYFPTAADSDMQDAYAVPMTGFGRLRAVHRANMVDPNGWGRTWYAGLLNTGRNDFSGVFIRRGVILFRGSLPSGKGIWPSLWSVNKASGAPNAKVVVEMDQFEKYEFSAPAFGVNAHNWVPGGQNFDTLWVNPPNGVEDSVHDYVWVLGDTTMETFVDGVSYGTIPIPNPTTVDPFFFMLDMAMDSDSGRPPAVPPSGYYDLWMEKFCIWSGD